MLHSTGVNRSGELSSPQGCRVLAKGPMSQACLTKEVYLFSFFSGGQSGECGDGGDNGDGGGDGGDGDDRDDDGGDGDSGGGGDGEDVVMME